MDKKIKRFIGIAVIIITVLTLFIIKTPGASSQEIPLEQLVTDMEEFQGSYLLTEGQLREETIQWDPDAVKLDFQIQDEKGNVLDVVYEGVRPDNFSEGIIVILEGSLETGVFHAEKVQTKCPSKYESEDSENYNIQQHEKNS